MARGYTVAYYLERIDAVRARIPHATFGTDVIVGFPGEDETAFANTCDVVQAVGFTNLHAFRFSPRSGTVAAGFPGAVPEDVKRLRADSLARQWRSGLRSARGESWTIRLRVVAYDGPLTDRRARRWRGLTGAEDE